MRHTSIDRTQLINLFPIVALCASLLISAGACAASEERGTTEESTDGDLLRGVLANSSHAVENAIRGGGNSNRIFGSSFYEWAMCAATEDGKEEILELLIDQGGNPNLVNPPAAFPKKYPLTCSLFKQNRKAYDILLNAGADLTIQPCYGCGENSRDTLITTALNTSNFDVARELLDILPVSEIDIQALKQTVEHRQTLPGSEHARYTLEFIDYLAERGITAVPPYPME